MNGLYLGMGGIGLILGSGPLAYLCASLGWRGAMIATGIVTVAIATALQFMVFDKPEDKGFESFQAQSDKKVDAVQLMKDNIRRICSSWQFWLIAVWFCCHFTIHMAFGGVWGGPFLMDVHHLSRVEAGNVINMMGIGMLVGGPINGYLSDKVFHARRPVMIINSLLMIATFGCLYALGENFSLITCYVWFFAIAAFGMGALSLGFASMKDIFGASATGTASGLLNAFPSFAVAFIQPLTGAILEASGKSAAGTFTSTGFSNIYRSWRFRSCCCIHSQRTPFEFKMKVTLIL
jgi:sugar phosphate permease